MSRKKPRKALTDPNTVHQVRLSDGRVVEWTGNEPGPGLAEVGPICSSVPLKLAQDLRFSVGTCAVDERPEETPAHQA
jgi:hypothetical protein